MLELIWEAGWIAKLVLLILFVASVASWAVIVFKWLEYRRAEVDTAEFLEAYIERSADGAFDVAKRCEGSPLAVIFAAGYRELWSRGGWGTMIRSTCPVVVESIRREYPELLPYLAELKTPVQAEAAYVREKHGQGVRIVYSGACLTEGGAAIDAAITLEELQAY